MSAYIARYTGSRWNVLYSSPQGQASFALEELLRTMQNFLPYVITVHPVESIQPGHLQDHLVLLGTPDYNPLIQELIENRTIQAPPQEEGYTLACRASPWNPECKMVVIAGVSAHGLLYGVETFNARILAGRALPEKTMPEKLRLALDNLEDFTIQESPRVPKRGLWTWGYVIHDYHRFLDNMARLKFNCLTVWNDVPPVNCREVIDYAHSRGIRLILGFPWGWGMDYNLADPGDRQRILDQVIEHYRQHIQPLQADGIYFQTLTEHHDLELGGHSVAALTCDLVNQVSRILYALTPDLDIRFGLHATSIRDHYRDLANLDPHVTIVWEDAGALPFSYTPTLDQDGITCEQTVAYARELATFRPGSTFAMIAKGWTTLDWQDEFEHHGPYLMGVRSPVYTRRRLELRQPRWEKVNALWMQYYPLAQSFYQEILQAAPGSMSVLGLVEDGLFEEHIQPSVLLFAETLWDPFMDIEKLLQHALSPYYKGIL
jgi:hypothetical protein